VTTQVPTQRANVPTFDQADRLAKARKFAGLDQGQLADAIGISRNSVSNYEAGKTTPRIIVLRAWAMATGVPVEWLLEGKMPDTLEYPDLDMTALLAPRAAPVPCAA
jgi:transcriptional regulator with XRE-family HTH domain